jgi:hypothetical protein
MGYAAANIYSDTSIGGQILTLNDNEGEIPLIYLIVTNSCMLICFYKLPANRADLFGIGAI